MGWLCPQCGSENQYRDKACPACLKKVGGLYRFSQRGAEIRSRRRSDAKENARLDRLVTRGGKSLKGITKMLHWIKLLLGVTCMLLISIQMFHITGEDHLRVAISDSWRFRLQSIGENLNAMQADKLLDRMVQTLGSVQEAFSSRLTEGSAKARLEAAAVQTSMAEDLLNAEGNLIKVSDRVGERCNEMVSRLELQAQSILRGLRSIFARLQGTASSAMP